MKSYSARRRTTTWTIIFLLKRGIYFICYKAKFWHVLYSKIITSWNNLKMKVTTFYMYKENTNSIAGNQDLISYVRRPLKVYLKVVSLHSSVALISHSLVAMCKYCLHFLCCTLPLKRVTQGNQNAWHIIYCFKWLESGESTPVYALTLTSIGTPIWGHLYFSGCL